MLEALCDLYPEADIYTHVYDEKKISDKIKKHNVLTTFINRLPFAKKLYPYYLPLMPIALEQIDLSDYDLIISSESGPSKGVVTPPDSVHICYCHSPMRYVWDMYHEYIRNSSFFVRLVMRPFIHYLRMWDALAASRVDAYIANSEFVASRVQKYYRRSATVINPPVSMDKFYISDEVKSYYLYVGQLVPYKMAALAVHAFNSSGKRLVIIGDGPMYNELKRLAGSNIELLGWQSDEKLSWYYANCRALIFPGIEDFGIVPLETMASGRPVIAFNKGGATETVIEGQTGMFFDAQSSEVLNECIERFEVEESEFVPEVIRAHAETFDESSFRDQLKKFISKSLQKSRS